MSRERWRSFLLHADRAELAGLNASAAKSRAQGRALSAAANLIGVGRRSFYSAIRGAPHRLRRLRGVELPVALFDAASPLVAGNGGTDMVRASSLACSGDFLLRLAICQSKHLIAKGG